MMTKTNDKLPMIIKAARLKMGMSQSEFGELFDPPAAKSIISRWEKGMSTPSPDRLPQLSKLTGCSVEELLYGSLRDSIIEILNKINEFTPFVLNSRTQEDFVATAPTVEEVPVYRNIYDYVTYRQLDSYKVRTRDFFELTKSDSPEDKQAVSDYYSEDKRIGDEYIINITLKIAKALNLHPYDRNQLLMIMADEAKKHFEDITHTTKGLLRMVLDDLTELTSAKIYSLIYVTRNGSTTRIADIDENIERKLDAILTNAIDEIDLLDEQV
ncbi:helix-turn-helix domain-containing protein [Latilactobacillus curvatus]